MAITESKSFKVLNITEMVRMGETNKVEKYYRHQIKTNGGVILTVDIDGKDFTKEKTYPILTKAAENADLILKG